MLKAGKAAEAAKYLQQALDIKVRTAACHSGRLASRVCGLIYDKLMTNWVCWGCHRGHAAWS
jgi:hypothetical protein